LPHQHRQQAGQVLSQQRLAASGRSEQQQMVVTGCCDLERAAAALLTVQVAQIGGAAVAISGGSGGASSCSRASPRNSARQIFGAVAAELGAVMRLSQVGHGNDCLASAGIVGGGE